MNDRFKFRIAIFNINDKGNPIIRIGWKYFDIIRNESDEIYDYPKHIKISKNEPVEYGDWQQCTGIKDKNGDLIYEGDMVKIKDSKGIIKFDYEFCIFDIFFNKDNTRGLRAIDTPIIEIINNIYQNTIE